MRTSKKPGTNLKKVPNRGPDKPVKISLGPIP
jgi:hypothetical protein